MHLVRVMECYRSFYSSKTSSGTHIVPAQQVNGGDEETITQEDEQQPGAHKMIYIVLPQQDSSSYVEVYNDTRGCRPVSCFMHILGSLSIVSIFERQTSARSGLSVSLGSGLVQTLG